MLKIKKNYIPKDIEIELFKNDKEIFKFTRSVIKPSSASNINIISSYN